MAPTRTLTYPAADDWETITPAALGWDPTKLETAVSFAGECGSRAFVVAHEGRIVIERYWDGADVTHQQDAASVQKSVVALLAGILEADGTLRLEDAADTYLDAGWAEQHDGEPVTLRHLLSMSSGLDAALVRRHRPGGAWFYNNVAYDCLKWALERASGYDLGELTRLRLCEPLALNNTTWEVRPPFRLPPAARDDSVSWLGFTKLPGGKWQQFRPDGRPYTQLVTSARDLARIGLLVLGRGAWDGRSIVESSFLETALVPSQPFNPAYGSLWWLNGGPWIPPSPVHSTEVPDPGGLRLAPAAPPDLVAALGANDQKIYVVPSLGLVVARMGAAVGKSNVAGSTFDAALWERLMAAVSPS